ncbi:MAG: glycine zipper 2TM domain-containing protein [Aquabacterium sp.]
MADIDHNKLPGDARQPAPRNSHLGRDAALVAGGAVLVGLGIAGGMMLSRHQNEQPIDMAAPGAGVTATDPQTGQPLAQDEALAKSGAQFENDASGQRRAVLTPKRERELQRDRATTSSSRNDATYDEPPVRTEARAICSYCGVVESVTPVAVQGQGTGIGAVAGGVVGGVLGNQVGKGSGNTAATVLGAIGGGLAGNEIEKHQRTATVYRVKVRMDDGTTKTFTRQHQVATGARVEVHGNEMKLLNNEG